MCLPDPATARDLRGTISIPATTLDTALVLLARESHAEIVSTEPGLKAVRTRPLHGNMSPRRALAQLLEDTGYRAITIAGGGFRVVRAPHAALARAAGPRREREEDSADIVVTASKQRISLLRYPGSLTTVFGPSTLAPNGARDLSDLAAILPILQTTQLGAGRNKVFIRGIADSSFNGATQSTASLYLDDVQLNYSGPDPGLRLYDVHSIDVLEGPQGTLYGAGAIGGVVRVTSNAPDLSTPLKSLSGGLTLGRSGAPGFDLAGVANVPILSDRVGLRVVGYRALEGGYIDDRGQRRTDVNRTDTVGGRAALRIDPGAGWRVDLSAAAQKINALDGQYAEGPVGRLTRTSRVAQPFATRLLFGRLLVSRDWSSGLRLVSATGVAAVDTLEVFNADVAAPPPAGTPTTLYTTGNEKRLLTQETRLSRSLSSGSWVAGFTLLRNRDILSRSLGAVGRETTIIGVTNVTDAASLFGEGTLALTRNLSVTVGARGTAARIDGEPSSKPRANNFVRGRSTKRFDPTVAVSWTFAPHVAAFARYQTGYRTGGLAVARGVGRVADYQADAILVGEVGVRKIRSGTTGIAASASLSFARWTGIQADLLNTRGQSYTVNLGNARIATLEGAVEWVPVRGLSAKGAFLYTSNQVSGAIADLSRPDNRRLPETPPLAASVELSYRWTAGRNLTLRAGGTANYVGRSVLGTGDLLDVSQGKYTTFGLSGGAAWRNIDVSIGIENLTDEAANRFAYGNPFALAKRNETTPLRPLNARIGVSIAW